MNWKQSLSRDSFAGHLRSLRLSLVETVFLIAAVVFALVVFFFFLAKVQPLRSELARLEQREAEANLQLGRMKSDERQRALQAANAEKIMGSLKLFEGYLKPDRRGMTQIINEIDSLAVTHGVDAGGAAYRVGEPEQTVDEQGNPLPDSELKNKKPMIYPVLGIETTVIGEYPNLRRFIGDLERSRQFLIINSLTFQGEAEKTRKTAGRIGPGQMQPASSDAAPVSLKIELDTYFRKED